MANIESILQQLKDERDRISAAIDALDGEGSGRSAHRSRAGGRRRRGKMSAEARARIAAAQRARWAKQKKQST